MRVEAPGEATARDAVRFERRLPGPIERLWSWLTEPDLLGQWFAGGAIDLRVGGEIELVFDHARLSAESETPERWKSAEGYRLQGQVTRCEPPSCFAFRWVEDDGIGGAHASEVSFDLSEQSGDVLLVLNHQRMPSREQQADAAAGWDVHLGILGDRLWGVEPRPFWTSHAERERFYIKRFSGTD